MYEGRLCGEFGAQAGGLAAFGRLPELLKWINKINL